MQETILQHLPTLRKAWIEWAISQSVSRIILFGWAALSDVSSWQRRNVESCLDLGISQIKSFLTFAAYEFLQ